MRLLRKIAEILQRHKPILFTAAEHEAFFASPVWVALRHELARQLDVYYRRLEDPACGIDVVNACRGGINAIEWVLDAPERTVALVREIEDIRQNEAVEQRLREITNMMEDERYART